MCLFQFFGCLSQFFSTLTLAFIQLPFRIGRCTFRRERAGLIRRSHSHEGFDTRVTRGSPDYRCQSSSSKSLSGAFKFLVTRNGEEVDERDSRLEQGLAPNLTEAHSSVYPRETRLASFSPPDSLRFPTSYGPRPRELRHCPAAGSSRLGRSVDLRAIKNRWLDKPVNFDLDQTFV